MMTEEEARNRWCPFVRLQPVASDVSEWHKTNRDEDTRSADSCNCIASACMAWRQSGVAKVENRQGQLVERDQDGTGRWHYEGYCGLAGRP